MREGPSHLFPFCFSPPMQQGPVSLALFLESDLDSDREALALVPAQSVRALKFRGVCPETFTKLIGLLKATNPSVEEVKISGFITPEQDKALAIALMEMPSMTRLDVSDCDGKMMNILEYLKDRDMKYLSLFIEPKTAYQLLGAQLCSLHVEHLDVGASLAELGCFIATHPDCTLTTGIRAVSALYIGGNWLTYTLDSIARHAFNLLSFHITCFNAPSFFDLLSRVSTSSLGLTLSFTVTIPGGILSHITPPPSLPKRLAINCWESTESLSMFFGRYTANPRCAEGLERLSIKVTQTGHQRGLSRALGLLRPRCLKLDLEGFSVDETIDLVAPLLRTEGLSELALGQLYVDSRMTGISVYSKEAFRRLLSRLLEEVRAYRGVLEKLSLLDFVDDIGEIEYKEFLLCRTPPALVVKVVASSKVARTLQDLGVEIRVLGRPVDHNQ